MAGSSQERSVTAALVCAPQVSTDTLVLARVGVALVFSGTSGLSVDLFDASLFFLEIFFRDFHFVDDDVLDAARKRWSVVGQDFLKDEIYK